MPCASRAARSASAVVPASPPARGRRSPPAWPWRAARRPPRRAASASRGADRRAPRASSATLRPISARNQAEMPVASPMTASGTPRRSRPSSRHRRESDGSRKRRSTIGAARPLGVPGRSRTPAPRSSIQRIGSSSSARGRPRTRRPGSRTSRVQDGSSASGPAPGLLQPAQRLVERRPEGPVDGHHLARRLHLANRACGRRSGTCRTGSAAA